MIDDTDDAKRGSGSPGRGNWGFFWIVPVIVAVWWPVGGYWQSDDYLAIHYSRDFGVALRDFIGPQYGIESLVMFYRPLITMSFAVDQWIGGDAAPFVSHLSNTIAHGLSAAVLACLAHRFVPRTHAFAAGLVWGLSPAHASTVFWAVGRVDCHTTLWMVLSALFLVQWCQADRRSRRPSVLCCVLAFGSKELAMVMPGIALVLCFVASPVGHRVRSALRGSWPFFLLLGLNLLWRKWRLGVFLGGYESAIQPVDALVGLGIRTAELTNPLLCKGSGVPDWFSWLGFVPMVLAILAVSKTRRWPLFAAALVLYIGTSVSTVQTWADTGNPMNIRNFYLPMMPLAVVLAAWGWRSALPAIVVAAVPFLGLRSQYIESWQRCSAIHESLGKEAQPGMNFIRGLQRTNPNYTALEFHLGVDRLLRPPFVGGADRDAYALRPMVQHPQAYQLPYGRGRSLPFGTTLAVGPADSVARVDVPADTTAMATARKGESVLTVPVLDRMVANYLRTEAGQPPQGQDPAIVLSGVRSVRYRVTVFTAGGYLTTFVKDSAPADSPDGQVAIGAILLGALHGESPEGGTPEQVGKLLQHATALDLAHRYPMLIEADTRPEFTGDPKDFRAARANVTPVWLDLPRLFANWWP